MHDLANATFTPFSTLFSVNGVAASWNHRRFQPASAIFAMARACMRSINLVCPLAVFERLCLLTTPPPAADS
jgi:hypothetical protein